MIQKFSPRQFDNVHVLFWLIKDLFWCLEIKPLAVFMIIPTVGLAIIIVIQSITLKDNIAINLSVLCWIVANSVWMLNEFFVLKIDIIPPIIFGLGIVIVLFHYANILFIRRKA